MTRQRYVKPQAQLLDRALAVSIGGCAAGPTPGNCGTPGFRAGTCLLPGNQEGVAPKCEGGSYAQGGCTPLGNWANF